MRGAGEKSPAGGLGGQGLIIYLFPKTIHKNRLDKPRGV
jgi:hypothetical protein